MRALRLVAILSGAPLAACACHRPATEASPSPGPAASAGPAVAERGLQGAPGAQTRVPREYLVTVAEGSDETAVRDAYGRFGIARVQRLSGHVFLVAFTEDPGLERLEQALRQDARIRAVQPNLVYRAR